MAKTGALSTNAANSRTFFFMLKLLLLLIALLDAGRIARVQALRQSMSARLMGA
jgi:hypothetical protein